MLVPRMSALPRRTMSMSTSAGSCPRSAATLARVLPS
jgi:hypothetical protein